MRVFHTYDNIISLENLLAAWREFIKDKKKHRDVEKFSLKLSENIFALHNDLKDMSYRHGEYTAFKINDPKPRDIHKATVRDRLLHHAIYKVLYPYFDQKFIFDSYSCRKLKGTHRAVVRLHKFARKISHNHTRTIFVLKCDIRKFFANIDHKILVEILDKHIIDKNIIILLKKIIGSFNTKGKQCVGLPLGNLTSQLLVNIYMNEFDHHIKRSLKVRHYIRYADDFVILNEDKKYLENLLPEISEFLENNLKLSLHPDKVFIKTLSSGVDFLGWINFPHHKVLRTSTKKRMFRNLTNNRKDEVVASYLGLFSHGNAHKLKLKIQSFKKSKNQSDIKTQNN